jgi:hypothetical protein
MYTSFVCKMVHWTDIVSAISRNGHRMTHVAGIAFPELPTIERIGFVATAAVPPVAVPPAAVPPAAVPPAAVPPAAPAPALRVSTKAPIPTKQILDPIVIGIEVADPLYVAAPEATRHQMEVEEAQRLESKLDASYKAASGRSRGWTKVGLEGMIKPRAASGGDLKSLARAKKPFEWSKVLEEKVQSAFLDFVCYAKQIRVVVWNFEKKSACLFPAADDPAAKSIPLYHMDSEGHLCIGLDSAADLLEFCDSNSWSLTPPGSVAHTLSTLTLAELESVGKKLGMAEVVGSKTERIESIAAYKLRLRLASESH